MIITAQIVNYKSRDLLPGCVRSLEESMPSWAELQLIIVNNDSEKLTGLNFSNRRRIESRIIEAGSNLGFGKAHNLGLKDAKGELLLLINPDTLLNSVAVCGLIEAIYRDERIGIIGPLLVGESGEAEEEHCGFIKNPATIIGGKLFRRAPEMKKGLVQVGWVSGGAMMIRKELFSELGGFDEKFFMYYEDVDLCLRAKQKKYQVMVHPELKIFHISGKSFENSKERKKHYYNGQKYYLEKNFGFWKALLVRIIRYPLYFRNVYLKP